MAHKTKHVQVKIEEALFKKLQAYAEKNGMKSTNEALRALIVNRLGEKNLEEVGYRAGLLRASKRLRELFAQEP